MARYSSRPRRSNRRSHYNKKRPNRMGQVLVIGVIVVAVLVYMLRRDKGVSDPNAVVHDINDVVNNMMSGQNDTDADARSVMNLPDSQPVAPTTIQEPNTAPTQSTAAQRQDMNAGTNPEVTSLFAQAMALYKSDTGRMIQVRDTLNEALRTMSMSLSQRMLIKDELTRLAGIWLFGSTVYADDPLCDTYLVQSGDNLERIGRNNDVPYQLLMKINNIRRASSLQAGVRIKVVNGPFNAVVSRSGYTLDLYLKNTYVKTYVVGLGRPGRETPTGTWLVEERLIRPAYTDPDTGSVYQPDDPEYPIGPYFIKLKGLSGETVGRSGFAIHGTNKPQEIGLNTSSGCIRLRNNEVEEVYGLLADNKSKVRVDP
ncbi:MAG: L,D-transpeptidase family protein [Phycisphaerae bacterium]|nr:L,D-transpeptidase family protein [Phycisphaerae bacterium]